MPVRRMLAAGALVWLAYAVAWVWVSGPVVDEAAVAAPVIAGAIAYPAGHPNALVYRHAPALSYQLAGLQFALLPDVWTLSATRNVLFLFLSAFLPFAATLACTRRPAWGHVAAALTVSETGCSLVGVYLMWIFPGVYSSGHLGIHAAALAIALTAAGLTRGGGFLAGLMPALHGPMTLIVWPALAWLWAGRRIERRGVLGATAVGILVAGAVLAGIAWRASGDTVSSLYAPGPDGPAVLATYQATTDPHRQPFPVWSPIGLVGPAALLALGLLALARGVREPRERLGVVALLAVGATAWVVVLGTRAWQALLGPLPGPISLLMPGRYANLAMLLVLPLATVVIASSGARAGALAMALLALAAGLELGDRRLAFTTLLPIVLGVALGGALGGGRIPRRTALCAAVVLMAAFVASGTWHPVVVAALVSAIFASTGRRLAETPPRVGRGLAIACVAAALAAMRGPHVPNGWDAGSERTSADERQLATWLAAHAPAEAMLVAPLWPPTWLQPKTGHPVLLDTMVLTNMPYFPSTASAVGRLVRDLFGVDYADAPGVERLLGADHMLRPTSPVWTAAWETRDCARWQELGRAYGFRYVWAERSHPVRLPVAWSGARWALHDVPDVCVTPAGAP